MANPAVARTILFNNVFGSGRGRGHAANAAKAVTKPANSLTRFLLGQDQLPVGLTLLTGAGAGAGKTVILALLTSKLAAQNEKVAYLDCDVSNVKDLIDIQLNTQPTAIDNVIYTVPDRGLVLETAAALTSAEIADIIIIDSLSQTFLDGHVSRHVTGIRDLAEFASSHIIPVVAACDNEMRSMTSPPANAKLILYVRELAHAKGAGDLSKHTFEITIEGTIERQEATVTFDEVTRKITLI